LVVFRKKSGAGYRLNAPKADQGPCTNKQAHAFGVSVTYCRCTD